MAQPRQVPLAPLRGNSSCLPEHGWLLAAVGLLGKVLGPLGLARLIWSGQWPWATVVLYLTNDFIWWIPFALYLYDAWPAFIETVP